MSRKEDMIMGFVIIVIALAVFFHTFAFPTAQVAKTGPALFPRVISLCLILLSLIMITISRKKLIVQKSKFWTRFFLPFVVFLAMVGYVILMNFIGFIVSTIVFLLLIELILKANLKRGALFAVCLTLAMYLVFQVGLKVPLPTGKLFGGL